MDISTLIALQSEGQVRHFRAERSRSLLASLQAQGRDWLPVGCRNGGCGICRIRVVNGEFDVLPMNRARISEEDQLNNIVLACRVMPLTDMVIASLPPTTEGATCH